MALPGGDVLKHFKLEEVTWSDPSISAELYFHLICRLCGRAARCRVAIAKTLWKLTMMGEAMSGVYLNVMSGIVRASIFGFSASFPDYRGTSVSNADDFIRSEGPRIQGWLNTYVLSQFSETSS